MLDKTRCNQYPSWRQAGKGILNLSHGLIDDTMLLFGHLYYVIKEFGLLSSLLK
jgi:hypothetical protein